MVSRWGTGLKKILMDQNVIFSLQNCDRFFASKYWKLIRAFPNPPQQTFEYTSVFNTVFMQRCSLANKMSYTFLFFQSASHMKLKPLEYHLPAINIITSLVSSQLYCLVEHRHLDSYILINKIHLSNCQNNYDCIYR